MDWQQAIALVIVVAAAAWLARRMFRVVRRGLRGGQVSDCGSCSRNPVAPKSPTVVQLGEKTDRDR